MRHLTLKVAVLGAFVIALTPCRASADDGVTVAQAPPPPPGSAVVVVPAGYYGAQPPSDPMLAARLYESGASMRSTGKALTFIGIGLNVLGIVLYVAGVERAIGCAVGETSSCDIGAGYLWGAVLSFLGGTASLGVGIPFWAVGASRMNRALRMGYTPAYVMPFVGPTHGGGMVAGLRLFAF